MLGELGKPLLTKTVQQDDIEDTLEVLDEMWHGVHLRKLVVVVELILEHLNVAVAVDEPTGDGMCPKQPLEQPDGHDGLSRTGRPGNEETGNLWVEVVDELIQFVAPLFALYVFPSGWNVCPC